MKTLTEEDLRELEEHPIFTELNESEIQWDYPKILIGAGELSALIQSARSLIRSKLSNTDARSQDKVVGTYFKNPAM